LLTAGIVLLLRGPDTFWFQLFKNLQNNADVMLKTQQNLATTLLNNNASLEIKIESDTHRSPSGDSDTKGP
jgi:hypothetical protein